MHDNKRAKDGRISKINEVTEGGAMHVSSTIEVPHKFSSARRQSPSEGYLSRSKSHAISRVREMDDRHLKDLLLLEPRLFFFFFFDLVQLF